MLDFTIRRATPHDAKDIATVHVKTWQCEYQGQIPDSCLNSLSIEQRTKTWKKTLNEQAKQKHSIVAVANQTVIGWCTYGESRDEDAADEFGELYGIYVHPDYLGKGAGSALMKSALDGLRSDGYKKATLWVLETNQRTRKFYQHHGWKPDGTKKEDPRDGFTLLEVRYVISLNG